MFKSKVPEKHASAAAAQLLYRPVLVILMFLFIYFALLAPVEVNRIFRPSRHF